MGAVLASKVRATTFDSTTSATKRISTIIPTRTTTRPSPNRVHHCVDVE